jgi:hypothetical protein
LCQLELALRAAHHQDLSAAELTDLHQGIAHAASPVDQDRITQLYRCDTARGVQGRGGAAAEGAGLSGIKMRWERDQHIGTCFHKLGVATIGREAELGDNMATQVLLPGPAPYTVATGTIVIDNDPIARLRSTHRSTGEDDLPHDLMAERQRSNPKIEQATQEMQLRATHPRMRDAYQGLPCPHCRDWHCFDLQRQSRPVIAGRLHRLRYGSCHPSSSRSQKKTPPVAVSTNTPYVVPTLVLPTSGTDGRRRSLATLSAWLPKLPRRHSIICMSKTHMTRKSKGEIVLLYVTDLPCKSLALGHLSYYHIRSCHI